MIRFVVYAPSHALILSFCADLRLAADGRWLLSSIRFAVEWRVTMQEAGLLNDPTEDITKHPPKTDREATVAAPLSLHRDQSYPDFLSTAHLLRTRSRRF